MASLYRKWRSASFEDLVGQEHVVRTLRNAVSQSRVAHAYLFTGPRGTGKTSTARILAKALNCLSPSNGNPCNLCENCVAANEGRALDVIEIDAASNTSVDNVRDLRERVGYAASEGRFKVYIIDEVHRLSGAAFDAFLKTLEEPPAHVVFVFASTEPHKVPATIMSRCQRFDFRRMSLADTVSHLKFVAQEEDLEVAEDALSLLGQHAGGSMRDALGLLDQVSSYTTGAIDAAEVRSALGLADPTLVARLVDHLLDGDVGEGLKGCGAFVEAGGDPGQLMVELVAYWRAVLLRVTGAGSVDGVVDPALIQEVELHAARVSERTVVAVLGALMDAEFSPKYDVPAQLSLEMAYVRAALSLTDRSALAERSGKSASTLPVQPSPAISTGTSPQPSRTERPPVPPLPPAGREESTSSRNDNGEHAVPETETERPGPGGMQPESGDSNALLGRIVAAMRSKSPSLQAVLRSGFILGTSGGEVTIGFEFPFHANVWTDNAKRKLLEEAVADAMGASYRVKCVRTTKDEVRAALGADAVFEDDGFVDEAAERLRAWHARQLGNGAS